MAATEIRAKEATVEIKLAGKRLGGSMLTIHDLSIKPDKEISKKRFPGMKLAVGDLDIKGNDFSFKSEKRDHSWKALDKAFRDADKNSQPFPEVTISITYEYRDGSGDVRTATLHSDLVMCMDDTNVPMNGYLADSWVGFASSFD